VEVVTGEGDAAADGDAVGADDAAAEDEAAEEDAGAGVADWAAEDEAPFPPLSSRPPMIFAFDPGVPTPLLR
jgi:hypothetical protein